MRIKIKNTRGKSGWNGRKFGKRSHKSNRKDI